MASKSGHSLAGYGLNYLVIAAEAKIEAGTGEKVVVLGYVVNGTGEISFSDGTSTWSLDVAENGGASYAGGPGCPAFECAEGATLTISGEATGHLTYLLV